jgi:hypothetical protein
MLFQIKKEKKKTTWTKEEDVELLSLTRGQQRRFNWLAICKSIPSKTPMQCYQRYRSINPNIKKGTWSEAEDKCLIRAVNEHGRVWKDIARLYFTNRNSKQIRDRYVNYLDPIIVHSKFSIDEDLLLIELQKTYGNKWTTIKTFFKTRSMDMLKNRFNSALKRNVKLYNVISASCGEAGNADRIIKPEIADSDVISTGTKDLVIGGLSFHDDNILSMMNEGIIITGNELNSNSGSMFMDAFYHNESNSLVGLYTDDVFGLFV